MEELLQRKTQLSQTHELSEKKVGIKFDGKMERGWRDLTFHLSLKPFAQNLSNSNCFHLMCSSKMSKMRWSTNLAFFGSWSAVAARLGGAQATLPRAIHNMDNMDSISTTDLQVCVITIFLKFVEADLHDMIQEKISEFDEFWRCNWGWGRECGCRCKYYKLAEGNHQIVGLERKVEGAPI